MNSQEEAISAALDGEAVDLQELRSALATDSGREALAAFVLLRAATAADDAEPSRTVSALAENAARLGPAEKCEPGGLSAWRWLLGGHRVPATLAATIATLAVALSFWLGTGWRAQPAHVGPRAIQATGSTTSTSAGSGRVAAPVSSRPASTPVPAQQPCTPGPAGPGAIAAPAGRAVAGQIRNGERLPIPTRFLQFVPGVDWQTNNGAQ
jgi:hypothetical protein